MNFDQIRDLARLARSALRHDSSSHVRRSSSGCKDESAASGVPDGPLASKSSTRRKAGDRHGQASRIRQTAAYAASKGTG